MRIYGERKGGCLPDFNTPKEPRVSQRNYGDLIFNAFFKRINRLDGLDDLERFISLKKRHLQPINKTAIDFMRSIVKIIAPK